MTISTEDLLEMSEGNCHCDSCIQTRALSSELLAARAKLEAAEKLAEASKRALNFIANTESEMGETLPCGDAIRAALAAWESLK